MSADLAPTAHDSQKPVISALQRVLPHDYIILPPTVRHPHVVVAHPDYGIVSVVMFSMLVVKDEQTKRWISTTEDFVPDRVIYDTIRDLTVALRAPEEQVTALIWLPNGIGEDPSGHVVASPDDLILGKAVIQIMKRRLTGSPEELGPWFGAYITVASAAKSPLPLATRELLRLIESCVMATVGTAAIVLYGYEITAQDLVDERFALPALMIAAFEDWSIMRRRERIIPNEPVFSVTLESDPNALLGFRLQEIAWSIPYVVLASIVTITNRCKMGNEYVFDDVILQFGRLLMKNDMDSSFIGDIEMRMASIID